MKSIVMGRGNGKSHACLNELEQAIKECYRLNQKEFCDECCRGTQIACETCRYEPPMKEPTCFLSARDARELYEASFMNGDYCND